MSRPARAGRRQRNLVSRQLPTAGNGTDEVDLAGACAVVLAHAEGRPVAPLIDPRRVADLIGGLAQLVATLAGQLGAGPGDPQAFRALLTDMQAIDRLIEIFGDPQAHPPP